MEENKLVTLAIRTSRRAEQIKQVLEKNHIATSIEHINVDAPLVEVGVRIRIKESDLPLALRLVEEREKAWEEEKKNAKTKNADVVLLPIDFSDFTEKEIDFAVHFAHALKAEIVLLHVYFVSPYSISNRGKNKVYSIAGSEQIRAALHLAKTERDALAAQIQMRMDTGEIPRVPFRFELKEGVPDDEIIDFCRKYHPRLVVMGTHGKSNSTELIGSVTGEVLEACPAPVFAVPAKIACSSPEGLRRIAFLTNFEQKDLISIDSLLALFGKRKIEVFFLHVAERNETWDEIILGGIKNYFSTHYPKLTTHYELLNAAHRTTALSQYLTNCHIDLLAFNTRRRNIFSRLLNPSLAYKMSLRSETPLFVTHI